MIELIVGFVGGAVATGYVGWRARRKAAVIEAPSPPKPQDESYRTTWTSKRSACLIFMCLPPEVSAKLFIELEPEDVQTITLEITRMPQISPDFRQKVISGFCQSLGISESRFEEAAASEAALVAKALQGLLHSKAPASF